MTPDVDVSVVVPYYDDQRRLDLTLAGLSAQRMAADRFEVIVADDGSPTVPDLGARPFAARTVRQEDRGFRAAAARNLGASGARGTTLCFLDADTVPTPDYLQRLTAACRDNTLVVGRREHVDLTGWIPSRLYDAWRGGVVPQQWPYPTWLADGYRATHNLTDADDASFRFVISAVMAMPRTLFDRVGGFDDSFVGYGGEDWDLAWRCWLAGADLRHVPDAVAWHDGPDAAGRGDFTHLKNRETLTLGKVLTHPLVRGAGLVHAIPDIAVSLDVTGWTLGQQICCVQSLLAGSDAGVWLTGSDAPPVEDPRVHHGDIPDRTLARCRYRVHAEAPFALRNTTLADAVTTMAPGASSVHVASTRELNRARTPVPWRTLPAEVVEDLAPDLLIERWRGRRRSPGAT